MKFVMMLYLPKLTHSQQRPILVVLQHWDLLNRKQRSGLSFPYIMRNQIAKENLQTTEYLKTLDKIFKNLLWSEVKVAQSCLTLCDPMDCSPPGSSVYGISQARIPEWVVISFSKGSSWPRDWIHVYYIFRWILFLFLILFTLIGG